KPALGGLVGIGCGSNPDRLAARNATDLFPERGRIEMFGENAALEKLGVAQFHELVGIARVAIFTAVLAAAIRIDGPDKRHARAGAAADEAAGFEFQILDAAFGFEALAFRSEFCDADELGRGRIVTEQHKVNPSAMFAFYSPVVKPVFTAPAACRLPVSSHARGRGIPAAESRIFV